MEAQHEKNLLFPVILFAKSAIQPASESLWLYDDTLAFSNPCGTMLPNFCLIVSLLLSTEALNSNHRRNFAVRILAIAILRSADITKKFE